MRVIDETGMVVRERDDLQERVRQDTEGRKKKGEGKEWVEWRKGDV